MINFRFHLVSLIAVFLALGLGILVGSSVVDQVIVDRLERDIANVRSESKERRTENQRLDTQINELEDAFAASAPYTVEARLEGVPVTLIAERGVDADVLKETKAMLQQSGAEVPAVLWLDDAWRLDDEQQLQKLGDTLGITGNAASTRSAALQALADRLAEPPATTAGSGGSTDVLTALEDAGFVSVTDGDNNALASFPSTPSRALVVTGTDSDLAGTDTLEQFVRALIDAKVPSAVAEAYDGNEDESGRGDAIAPVRGDSTLADVVSTLDDIELVQGRVGAVLALEQLADGTVGHYGYGRGADSPVPRTKS
jgi:hypothetical protein